MEDYSPVLYSQIIYVVVYVYHNSVEHLNVFDV